MRRTATELQGLRLIACVLAATIFVGLQSIATARAQTVEVDASLLQKLQQIIEQQQEQLGKQSETIESLNSRVGQLEGKTEENRAIATKAQTTAEQVVVAAPGASAGREPVSVVAEDNTEKVKLAISGHINRAMNVVNDGDETKAYFVDNDVSSSRVRFVGTGNVTDTFQIGSVMELAFSPNNSFDVSQDNEKADDFVDVRKVEGFFRDDRFGQMRFGKGQAAADDTVEYDLSLVAGPLMYSGVADPYGGVQFSDDGNLTGTIVADAFFNFDGNRQDRVMYDTPVIGPGLQLAGSAGSDQRWDLAMKWGHDYGDWSGVDIGPFTTLGAVSIRDPNEDDVDWRLGGSFSTLHNPTGISLTVSGGMDSEDNTDDPYNLYGKLAWDTTFFDFGKTGFGVDFAYNQNSAAEGDIGRSFGLAAIQLIEDHGTELYAQFRIFDLDRRGDASVDDIVAGTIGTRVKF